MSRPHLGENLEVDTSDWREANAIHLWRYYNARGFIEQDDKVIDLGCGHGYGTEILSRSLAEQVTGYDYDKIVLENKAKKLYQNDKVTFFFKDFEKEDIPKCDYLVCIEVLEHINDPKSLIQKMKDSARRIIFVSIPLTPRDGANKFHKHDFTAEKVQSLFRDDEWETLKWSNLGGNNGLFLFYSKVWQKSS